MLLNKAGKGLITRYLMKVTSYSHAKTKRLIRQYLNAGKVTVRLARGSRFKPTYTSADVRYSHMWCMGIKQLPVQLGSHL
jgi:hypothetical protein